MKETPEQRKQAEDDAELARQLREEEEPEFHCVDCESLFFVEELIPCLKCGKLVCAGCLITSGSVIDQHCKECSIS